MQNLSSNVVKGSQLSIPTIKYPHEGENTPALRCVWINTSPPHRERGVLRVRGNLTGGLLVPLGIQTEDGVTGVLILALSLPCRFAKGIYQRLPRPSAKGSSREPLIPSCSPREREMAGFRVKRSISQRRGERSSIHSLTDLLQQAQ